MSWASLETTAEHIKGRESLVFGSFTDDDAKAIMKDLAKDQVKRDLADALNITTASDYDTTYDTLATDYADILQRALAYLQLHLWFTDQSAGVDSANQMKADHYLSEYRREQRRFKTLGNYATSSTVGSQTLWR